MTAPTPPPPPPAGDEARESLPSRAWSKFRSWPIWAQGVIGVVLLLFVIGAAAGDDGEEEVETQPLADTESTTTTEPADIEDILDDVTVAGVDSADLREIVETACSELEDAETTEDAASGTFRAMQTTVDELDGDTFDDLVDVIADAAPQLCPDAVEEHPEFLAELQALAPVPTTTTTTTTTTTAPPTTTTTTTAPAPPPTTAAPAPPPPPPTQAPSTSYNNCSEARADGAAPLYRGDPGYGSHLDRDDDGVACE